MSSHWYLQNGMPFYTIQRSDGTGIRDVTLRDAKKVQALYSTTYIINQLSKPQLEKWKIKQILDVCFDHTAYDSREEWEEKVWKLYREKTEVYSTQGMLIHNQLETYYLAGIIAPDAEDIVYPVIELIEKSFKHHKILKYRAEESFANKKGYGGKIDLIIETEDGIIILDFKTKQGDKLEKQLYNDYSMQLAAYSDTFKNVLFCGNVLISVTHPGINHIHVWSDETIQKSNQMFNHLLEYCKLVNNYDPAF